MAASPHSYDSLSVDASADYHARGTTWPHHNAHLNPQACTTQFKQKTQNESGI